MREIHKVKIAKKSVGIISKNVCSPMSLLDVKIYEHTHSEAVFSKTVNSVSFYLFYY